MVHIYSWYQNCSLPSDTAASVVNVGKCQREIKCQFTAQPWRQVTLSFIAVNWTERHAIPRYAVSLVRRTNVRLMCSQRSAAVRRCVRARRRPRRPPSGPRSPRPTDRPAADGQNFISRCKRRGITTMTTMADAASALAVAAARDVLWRDLWPAVRRTIH